MIVIVGASASGKSTLQKEMIEHAPNKYKKVVTYTTRPPRPGEKDGIDYHFVTESVFQNLVDEGFFIEHNQYRGWKYGTAKEDCHDENSYIAVLTPAGFRQLKKTGIKTTSIFLHVDRRSLLINILQRGDDIDESYRRNTTDVGQFDGIENEVDYVIDNTAFRMNKDEVRATVNKIIGVA